MPRRHFYDLALLDIASELSRRPAGQRGTLSTARARRSVSTAYYALFHFILEEATRSLLGTHHDLLSRRRTLARAFSHAGIKKTLEKIKGATVDPSVQDFLRPRHGSAGSFAPPPFAREMANTFAQVQVKRHEADYDLNTPIGPADASIVIGRALLAVAQWQAAMSNDDRDFKHALFVLMLLKGELRREA
jgi:hypothetical protein